MSANMAESSRPLHHYTDSVMTWQNVHTGDAVLYHDPGKASGTRSRDLTTTRHYGAITN